MNWWDYVGIASTLASLYGAYKSNVYYKKSKQLTMYANTNIAYMETEKIINTFPSIVKLANNTTKRGTNYQKKVSQYGEEISNSISKIRDNLTAKDLEKMNNTLNELKPTVDEYINSFISGEVLVDEKFIIDDNFNNFRKKILSIQVLLKKKKENIEEKPEEKSAIPIIIKKICNKID